MIGHLSRLFRLQQCRTHWRLRKGWFLLGLFVPQMISTPFSELWSFQLMELLYRPTGPKSKLINGRTVINLASYNFYNFVSNEALKEKAIQTLRTYGVGPCGPPGFYGTLDVHKKP